MNMSYPLTKKARVPHLTQGYKQGSGGMTGSYLLETQATICGYLNLKLIIHYVSVIEWASKLHNHTQSVKRHMGYSNIAWLRNIPIYCIMRRL